MECNYWSSSDAFTKFSLIILYLETEKDRVAIIHIYIFSEEDANIGKNFFLQLEESFRHQWHSHNMMKIGEARMVYQDEPIYVFQTMILLLNLNVTEILTS